MKDILDVVQGRLTQFIEGLPVTRINIVYLNLKDKKNKLFEITLKDTFRLWTRKDDVNYICPGTPGWCYVYVGSDMGNMVRLKIDKEEVYAHIGHHLTFGVILSKGQIVMRNHHTRYTIDDKLPSQYYRDENTCNVLLEVGKEEVLPFDKSCIHNPNLNIGNVYDKKLGKVVQDISRVYYGSYKGGKKQENKGVQVGARGGRYLVKGGKKVYLGGTCSYKGVSFSNDDFLKFITDFVIQPVARLKEDLEEVTLIYDEGNELDPKGNKYIIVIYDFVEVFMHCYYLEAEKAFQAFYAYQNKATANEAEQGCLQEFLQRVKLDLPVYVLGGSGK
jgi:hypothetical protein